MIDDIGQLRGAILAGDFKEHRHPNVELKESWHQDAGHDISGLCNKIAYSNSWLVVGLKNNGECAKRDENWAQQTERTISQHIHSYLDPHEACRHIECQEIPGGWIVVIHVHNPGAVVYWNGVPYKLHGTVSKKMVDDEPLALTLALPGLHDLSNKQCDPGKIDGESVLEMARRIKERDRAGTYGDLPTMAPDAVLQRLGIAQKQVAKILFGSVSFRLVYYNAAGVPIINDRISPLYKIFSVGLRRTIETFSNDSHSEAPERYPVAAFQEAMANAVAHAAYFEDDGDLMVEVYPDRVCVSNLCTRESLYFANRWFSRNHKTINKALVETLRLAGHVDELGRGKTIIFGDYLVQGREPPLVSFERVHRLSRWRLTLPGSPQNEHQIRLFEAIRAHYRDEQKARIALALVLWRARPVQEIRQSADGEFAAILDEVLTDLHGPVYWWQERDALHLARWAQVLLHEGLETKALSEAEERHLFKIAYQLCTRYHSGAVTPEEIRNLGQLGKSKAACKLSSRLLQKWAAEGRVIRPSRGKYCFKALADLPPAAAAIIEPPTSEPERQAS